MMFKDSLRRFRKGNVKKCDIEVVILEWYWQIYKIVSVQQMEENIKIHFPTKFANIIFNVNLITLEKTFNMKILGHVLGNKLVNLKNS